MTRIVLTESVDARDARIAKLRIAAAVAQQERDRAQVYADNAAAELVRAKGAFELALRAYNAAKDKADKDDDESYQDYLDEQHSNEVEFPRGEFPF